MRSVFHRRSAPLIVATLIGAFAGTGAHGATAPSKNVLVLYGERHDLPGIRLLEQGLRDELDAAMAPRVDCFSEYFDFARFSSDEHEATVARYLRERYADRRIDMVVPIETQALAFALCHRDELFPGVPIVFAALDLQAVDARLPPDVTGVTARVDFERTIELARALQPDAREIVVVVGESTFDTSMMQQARQALDHLPGDLRWRAIMGRSLDDIVGEVSRVPPGDIVLITSIVRDGDGHARSIPEVARALVPVSRAPIYGVAGTLLETGVVGGAMFDLAAVGHRTAEVALQAMRGEHVPETVIPSRLVVDWRGLSHWGLSASRVPPQATILFEPPTLWEAHRGAILGIVVVCAAQSITIAVLLAQWSRRRRSEASLRESEARMSLAAEAANLGLWLWDVERGDSWMTPQCCALFGFEPHEKLTSERIMARVHPEDRLAMEGIVRETFARSHSFDTQCRLLLPDGRERSIAIVGRVQHAPSGAVSGVRGVCIDITARKEAEREAQQRRDELTHMGRVTMLGELSASTAHELNQPLTAILSNAQAALRFLDRDSADLDEVRDIIKDIVADDQRAADVIQRLRALFKRDTVRREPLDVNEVTRDALRLAHGDLVTRDVRVSVDLAPDLPTVAGDRVQIQQVLLNLLLNACDAVAGNGPADRDVTVRTGRVDGAGVRVSVVDRGHGIEADQLERVFEPFVTTKAHGVGLGLSISRSIVAAHGGRLWAENGGDRGTTVTLELPDDTARET